MALQSCRADLIDLVERTVRCFSTVRSSTVAVDVLLMSLCRLYPATPYDVRSISFILGYWISNFFTFWEKGWKNRKKVNVKNKNLFLLSIGDRLRLSLAVNRRMTVRILLPNIWPSRISLSFYDRSCLFSTYFLDPCHGLSDRWRSADRTDSTSIFYLCELN